MRRITGFIVAILLATSAQAQSKPIASAKLVVDAPIIKRGQPVSAAVTFTMPEHWHIYWLNAGDSGLATKLEWQLPDGLSAGEIEWPLPERIDTQGIINYGYSNSVTLPVVLRPTRDGVAGEVRVKASWLVCKDICIPESAELSAMLTGDAEAARTISSARALVPQPFNGTASFDVTHDAVTLTIRRDNPWGKNFQCHFLPNGECLMLNGPLGTVKQVGNELTFTLPRGQSEPIATWHGVLNFEQDGKRVGWLVTAKNNAPASTVGLPNSPLEGESNHSFNDSVGGQASQDTPHEFASTNSAPPQGGSREFGATAPPSFLIALLLAFIGGLILNIMPCVLPILALKALALAKKSQASRRAAMLQGLSYTGGVILSFLLIAGAMLALKATGSAIGWGFQLQNPAFVGFLALVMLLVSANLLGLFELPVLFGERATAVDDSKLRGSFLTGVLAVMVATPCTAPFMATAIGATLSYGAVPALAVFASLGLGMAAPFLIISLWPAARRLLPKPGAWMHRFKQILAIPMLATAAWLLFVLVQLLQPMTIATSGGHEMYSAPRLQQLRDEGTPVLIDATAAWCLTCKVNERVALKPDSMQQFLKEKNVTLMVADWTSNDPEITKLLAQFGRNGVPLYVYYPPHSEPKVLPQILTPSVVRDAINE